MDITREQREERFLKAPPAVRALYDAPESGTYLLTVFAKYRLPQEKYKPYAIAIGNVILGFYPLWQLPELLQEALGIPAVSAMQIAGDLRPFFAPIAGGMAGGAPPIQKPIPPPRQEARPPQPPALRQMVQPNGQTWQHMQEQKSPAVPQYQKPLTFVPQQPPRNAHLYKKP